MRKLSKTHLYFSLLLKIWPEPIFTKKYPISPSSHAAGPQSAYNEGPFGFEKLWEADSLNWSHRFFSNFFSYVSYIFIYICHCFILPKKILFWNDTWKSVTCRFKKLLRKAILLNPAEVAFVIPYIDSLWVKESKYNSTAMPFPASSGYTEPLSFIFYRTRSWTM